MKIKFISAARLEFLEIVSFYEKQRPGLGLRFTSEVFQTLRWLQDHPNACRRRPGGYRQLNLRVFPYYIPYMVRKSTLWVLAIAHMKRKPKYWITELM